MTLDPPRDPPSVCPRCGATVASGARYCGHCGLSIPTEGGPAAPESPNLPAPTGFGPPAGDGLVADFILGLDLLKRYPAMVMPPLVAMAFMLVVGLIFFGSAATMFAVGGLSRRAGVMVGAALGGVFLFLVCFAGALLINLVSSAVVVVMAREALAGRRPMMGAAYSEVIGRLGAVVGASLLYALIVGVASVFLFVPGLVAAFFLMFVLPAVLLDRLGPIDGLKRSAALVRNNAGRAFGLVVGAIVASVAVWMISAILHALSVVGHLVSMLLAGAFVAYLTIVAVRVFQTLPIRRPA